MIQYIRIQNFRSVKDIALELGPLNIVFGLTAAVNPIFITPSTC